MLTSLPERPYACYCSLLYWQNSFLSCRHLTCPVNHTSCALCQQNPNRRCELGNNFAPKQLEKQPLITSCGSPINISLKNLVPAGKDSTAEVCSSSTSAALEPERLCLEVRQATSQQPYITVSICLCVQLRNIEKVHLSNIIMDPAAAGTAHHNLLLILQYWYITLLTCYLLQQQSASTSLGSSRQSVCALQTQLHGMQPFHRLCPEMVFNR